jgi:hypothetical protein
MEGTAIITNDCETALALLNLRRAAFTGNPSGSPRASGHVAEMTGEEDGSFVRI